MPHKPFAILDYTTGQFLAKQPFLSPKESYRELTNGRVYRGRLEKRDGYVQFGFLPSNEETVDPPGFTGPGDIDSWFGFPPEEDRFFNEATGKWVGLEPSTALFSRLLLAAPVPPINALQGELKGYQDVSPGMGNDVVSIVSVNCDNPANDGVEFGQFFPVGTNDEFRCEWKLHPEYSRDFLPGDLGLFAYHAPAGLPITGIASLDVDGSVRLVAFNTESCFYYDDGGDPPPEEFIVQPDSVGNIIFPGGTKDDLIWTWPVSTVDETYLIFTNNIDPVQRWTFAGTPFPVKPTPVNINPQSLPGEPDAIDTSLLVVVFQGRLIYLGPTEDLTVRRRRARWTIAGSFETFDDDTNGWADAPSELGDIRTAGFVGDRLYVGFVNGWMELRPTGDPISPFAWIPLISRYGAGAKLTTIHDAARLLSRSTTSMQAVDPNGQYPVDSAIPDYVTTWSNARGIISAAIRNEEERSYWWSYVSSSAEEADSALVGQYDDEGGIAWARYTMGFRVFGLYARRKTLNWDDLPGNWNDYGDIAWDAQDISSGFPLMLGGQLDGFIHQIGFVSADNGLPIDFVAQTQALVPFPDQRAHFGWLDIYAEAVEGSVLDITFYDRVGANGYKTVAVDFSPTPGSTSGKVYRRIRVGHTSEFHQLRLHTNSTQSFAIDALIPWFRPAGIAQDFG